MRQFQLVVFTLIILSSTLQKPSPCTQDVLIELSGEPIQHCVNHERLTSVILPFAIILSLLIERLDFRLGLAGLLVFNSVFSLIAILIYLDLFTYSYAMLITLQKLSIVVSTVFRNLVLISALNSVPLQEKPVVIVIYRVLDIISVQLPAIVVLMGDEIYAPDRQFLYLIESATALCLSMWVFNGMHKSDYSPIETSDEKKELNEKRISMWKLLISDFKTVSKYTFYILVLIGIVCFAFAEIINAWEFIFPRGMFVRETINVAFNLIGFWIGSEIFAGIVFIYIARRFGLKGIIITAMAVFTIAASSLGFIPLPLSDYQRASRGISVTMGPLQEYLFFAAKVPASILIMTCMLVIATNVPSGIRCSSLTVFSIAPQFVWSFVIFVEVSPPKLFLFGSKIIDGNTSFLTFAWITIVVFLATLFIRVNAQHKKVSGEGEKSVELLSVQVERSG